MLCVSLAAFTAQAADPTKQQCVEANDAAQDLRQFRKLRQAREELAICASGSCPAVVRDDCMQRLDELNKVMPTVVFIAKDKSGNDLGAVRVTMDGLPFAEKLDGAALPADLGEHHFVLELQPQAAVHRVVEKTLILHEGDRRRENVVFGGIAIALHVGGAESPHVESASPATSSAAPGSSGSGIERKTIAFAVGGAGVAGLVVGSIFGAVASSKWSAAKNDCGTGCGPTAPARGEKSTASSDAAISTVAFVVGGALAAGGVALYLTGPSGSTMGLRIAPAAGSSEAGMVLAGGF